MKTSPLFRSSPALALFLFSLLCCFIFFPETAFTEERAKQDDTLHYISPDEQLAFAEQYFERRQFSQAITEYERFVFFFPNHPRVPHAEYQIARARFNSRQFHEALEKFKHIAQAEPVTGRSINAYFDLSDCLVQLKDYPNAVNMLGLAADLSPDINVKDLAFYRTGWVFIEDRKWEHAKTALHKISPDNSSVYQVAPLLNDLDAADDISMKNPVLAGFFSIIPGGGYLYCNRPKDAFMAFLLNGGLIWAAVEAFDNDSPALGSMMTFVELGFYAGNIYGGISSAHKYNEKERVEFIDNLRQKHRLRFSINPLDSKVAITIQTPF